jgi:hypothetical protein
MKKTEKRRIIFFPGMLIACMCAVILSTGCMQENETAIRHKLELICEEDMQAIVEDVPVSERLDPVYYTISVFKKYDEGRYSYMAAVEFYYLKRVKIKTIRKYRYHSLPKLWERYSNEEKIIHETGNTGKSINDKQK